METLARADQHFYCQRSDADQFGGRSHKRYQSTRLKNFLSDIRVNSIPEQDDILFEEIEKRRDEKKEEQTDDIPVTGIRI